MTHKETMRRAISVIEKLRYLSATDIEDASAEAMLIELRAAIAEPDASELVFTFNFGKLVKVSFQDRVLYEVDLSPKPYFEVCWANAWAGDYASEEEAREDCLSLCGYGRDIREVKPGDEGYKNPRIFDLTEQRLPLFAAPVKPAEPVKYLANGARFKTSEFPYGVCINGLPKELAGCWVALVAAEDDCHLKAAPVKPVPLTDERISRLWSDAHNDTTDRMAFQVFARAIERAVLEGMK